MISNANTDSVYIGSTCQSLDERFKQHLSRFREWSRVKKKDIHKYKGMTSYKVFKDGFSKITLVEDYPCDSIRELRKREGEVIQEHATAVNTHITGRTYKEWKADKKQVEMDLIKTRSIPKSEGVKETTVQDMLKDLDMMSAF